MGRDYARDVVSRVVRGVPIEQAAGLGVVDAIVADEAVDDVAATCDGAAA